MADRLSKLLEQRAALDEKTRAKKATLTDKIRKLETRRKIIAGGIALAHCEHDPQFKALFEQLLDRFVRGDDRALFGLAPAPPRAPANPANDNPPPQT